MTGVLFKNTLPCVADAIRSAINYHKEDREADTNAEIITLEVYTQDGMGQRQESEGRLSYLRPADRLLPPPFLRARSLGT